MARAIKTFALVGPKSAEKAASAGSAIKIDLGGLKLSTDQIESIRQSAVKAALSDVQSMVDAAALDSFSTFSTFSTFGSGSMGMLRADVGGELVGRVLGR
ncbi:hypothetical protein [Aureimonas glaciei]|uniref:Uncharacterized protein n=1 Tax=Aureimonas glaciei TaxID=1776957 RepID=A0A917D7S0_9HYPH|nr:hypothetical protein [Aureimonas glaciei]GGD12906.1 hypothetical protein GCM10011335_14690 [Aureimonas glaciei]